VESDIPSELDRSDDLRGGDTGGEYSSELDYSLVCCGVGFGGADGVGGS